MQDFFSRPPSDKEKISKPILIGDVSNRNYISIENTLLAEFSEIINEGPSAPYSFRRRRKINDIKDIASHETPRRALEIKKGDTSQNLLLDSPIRSAVQFDKFAVTPCGVVPTRTVMMDELAQSWDSIVFSPDETLVQEAIKFISPDFQDLTFIETEDFVITHPLD